MFSEERGGAVSRSPLHVKQGTNLSRQNLFETYRKREAGYLYM